MDIKPGDILLEFGSGLIGGAIDRITHSKYSHAAGIVKTNELIEANWQGVQWQALDYYAGCADIFTCDVLTDQQREQIQVLAIREVGDPYDYPLLFWQFLRYRFNLRLPYREGKARECSVLWARLYRQVGVDLCPGIEYPSPADLSQSKLLRKIGSI